MNLTQADGKQPKNMSESTATGTTPPATPLGVLAREAAPIVLSYAPTNQKRGGLRRFLRRHFAEPPTRRQDVFDVLFGIVVPLIYLNGDPILFVIRGIGGMGLLVEWRSIAYLFSALQLLVLFGWLAGGRRCGAFACACFAGLLLVGGAVSAVFGVALALPSVPAILFFGVGLFGFAPLVASFVFVRNSYRAFRAASVSAQGNPMRTIAISAAVAAVAIPLGLNHLQHKATDHAIHSLLRGNPIESRATRKMLRDWGWALAPEALLAASASHTDAQRNEAFCLMTGFTFSELND